MRSLIAFYFIFSLAGVLTVSCKKEKEKDTTGTTSITPPDVTIVEHNGYSITIPNVSSTIMNGNTIRIASDNVYSGAVIELPLSCVAGDSLVIGQAGISVWFDYLYEHCYPLDDVYFLIDSHDATQNTISGTFNGSFERHFYGSPQIDTITIPGSFYTQYTE